MQTLALTLHIAAGAAALLVGPIAMFTAKRKGVHTRSGELYHWLVAAVAASAVLLALFDWQQSWWLALVAVFSYAFALVGYLAAKRRRGRWLPAHVTGQGGSYIALITALLVVNAGRDELLVWLAPTIVGSPLIAWVNFEVIRGRRPRTWAVR